MKWAVVTPAYGRVYTSEPSVLADFNWGKDFILHDPTSRWDGKPCNIRDLKKYSEYTHVEIRYGEMLESLVVKTLKAKDMT